MDLESFDWLVGSWRLSHSGTTWEEHWLPPLSDAMVAVTRWVRNGETALVELTTLQMKDDQPILHLRHFDAALADSGDEGTMSWPLLELKGRMAIFEEPFRDFPRRVVYHRVESDLLAARLEGVKGGQETVKEYMFTLM